MTLNQPITELDFETIKQQFRTYLEGQSAFKDYNFDGSNMSVLLEVLAYNGFQQNFYTNMAFSEMFLDSAERTSSIMSHAKELNYLPRSAVSSKAIVNLSIVNTATTDGSILIPAKTKFTTNNNGRKYNFYTDQAYIAVRTSNTNIFSVNCVAIYEGSLVEEVFSVAESNDYSFEISNENVDTSSITLTDETNDIDYFYSASIYGVDSDDAVFYLEPSPQGSYKITFGRDIYGRTPPTNSSMRVSYRTSNGAAANGARKFTTSFTDAVTVTATARSNAGADKESNADIKYFAPKSIQIQERAVTRRDYETLLKQRFVEILDVSAYDGADLSPPQHGKVAISVAVDGGVSEASKQSFIAYLEDKTPLAIQPVFIEAGYMYIDMGINVYVNRKTRTKTDAEITAAIKSILSSYTTTNLNKFNSTFRTSRVSYLIDQIDESILSNSIFPEPYILYTPEVNVAESISFNFKTPLQKPYKFVAANGLTNYTPAVVGRTFTWNSVEAFFQDDGNGTILILANDVSNVQVLSQSAGTVDYTTGTIALSDFVVSAYDGSGIKIQVNTIARDITPTKNRILSINTDDVTVTVIEQE